MAFALLGVVGAGGVTALTGCSDDDTTSDRSAGGDGAGAADPTPGTADGSGTELVMYSSPTCGCCGEYEQYLQEQGYTVDSRDSDDLDAVKADAGVPEDAAGCHTTLVGDYVVEGHVPVEAIDRLLRERPSIDGIALPGMPAGSPGMGPRSGPLDVVSIDGGTLQPYMTI